MKAALLVDYKLQVLGDDYDTPDSTCIRDYIHVDDLAGARLESLDHLVRGGALEFNHGTGIGSSVLEVIEAVEHISGTHVPHEVVGRRPSDPVSTYAAPESAE
jgi:UDP-glucose 4-epimerase